MQCRKSAIVACGALFVADLITRRLPSAPRIQSVLSSDRRNCCSARLIRRLIRTPLVVVVIVVIDRRAVGRLLSCARVNWELERFPLSAHTSSLAFTLWFSRVRVFPTPTWVTLLCSKKVLLCSDVSTRVLVRVSLRKSLHLKGLHAAHPNAFALADYCWVTETYWLRADAAYVPKYPLANSNFTKRIGACDTPLLTFIIPGNPEFKTRSNDYMHARRETTISWYFSDYRVASMKKCLWFLQLLRLHKRHKA